MEDNLKDLRTGAGISQVAFAQAMGLPLRTYEDLESGRTTVRPAHICAAYWALIRLAAESPLGIGFLPLNIAEVVRKAAMTPEQKKAANEPPTITPHERT